MVPVAVSLIGTGMQAWSIAFIGWFGPRGLASVVFALLAIEDLDVDDALRTAIATLAMTVLLSVILHGLTADVLAARYGAWIDRTRPPTETAAATEPRPRRSPGAVAPPTFVTPSTGRLARPRCVRSVRHAAARRDEPAVGKRVDSRRVEAQHGKGALRAS